MAVLPPRRHPPLRAAADAAGRRQLTAAPFRRALEVLNEEGVEAALEWFTEDFHGAVPPELSAEPDSYDGHAGVRRYFESFADAVENLRMEPDELVELAPGAVGARVRVTGRGRESGIPVEMRVQILVRVRDGKLAGMVAYADWDEMVAAGRA